MKIAMPFFLMVALSATGLPAQHSRPVTERPNIIVILTDDQGYGDVGFNGSTDIHTPQIDRLARNGVIFSNGYVSFPVCGPSRAGLITGRYQDRFGFGRNPLFAPKDSTQGLPRSEETLAEALKRAGYHTMAIGKWHLGTHESLRPLKRGFDAFFGFLSGGHKYFPSQWTLADLSEVTSQFDAYNTRLLRNDTRVDERDYLTDAFSREAVAFVRDQAAHPFFLYLAYNAPHTPLQATEAYLERNAHIANENRRTYASMITAVDDGVGHLLDALEELGIHQNTLIFFLSDNGGAEDKGADNGALRNGKGSMYEGGIRIPFVAQWPGVIPEGSRFDRPVISLDIFATAAALSGITPRNPLDGTNLVPYLTAQQDEDPHTALFWKNNDRESFAVRMGFLKLVRDRRGLASLYNLGEDLGETLPLADSVVRDRLLEIYEQWNAATLPPRFDGLLQDSDYSKKHPERFKYVEKY